MVPQETALLRPSAPGKTRVVRGLLRFSAVVALAVGLGGCATGRVVVAPDGQPAVYVACRDQYQCQVKSQRLCGAGFQVVSGGPNYWLIRCAQYQYYPQ
jgi:hypothetical protein